MWVLLWGVLTSIIIPLFNERASLALLADEIRAVADAHGLPVEIIFVDDGSVDGSWERICELVKQDAEAHADHVRLRGVRLGRNSGKSIAIAAGLAAARGERIATLDADLQDDPHELPGLLDALDGGLDMVVGWKRRRQDAWTRIRFSRMFNVTVSLLSGVRLHDHNCGLKAFRREVVPAMRMERGMHRFMTVMAAAAGFRVGQKEVRHRPRQFGRSKYGWGRVPESAWDLARVMWRTRWMRRSAAGVTAGDAHDTAGDEFARLGVVEQVGVTAANEMGS